MGVKLGRTLIDIKFPHIESKELLEIEQRPSYDNLTTTTGFSTKIVLLPNLPVISSLESTTRHTKEMGGGV